MEWRIWITWWIIFCIRYSRLFWEKTDNPSKRVCVNKIEKRIKFKIKRGYYLGGLMTETMKLLGCCKSKITKDENGENVLHLEMTELVLIHCAIVNNDYPQNSRALHTFVPNKSFRQLLDISPKHFIILKTFDSEHLYIEAKFADQNSKPLEKKYKRNNTLVIN